METRLNRNKPRALENTRIDDVLYYCALAVWIVPLLLNRYTFFATTVTGDIVAISRYCAAGLIVASEVVALKKGIRWGKRTAIAAIVCIVLAICCYRTKHMGMLFSMLVLFGARNHDPKTIFKVLAAAYAATLIVTVLCSQLGVIDDHLFDVTRNRRGIGFRHPLYPSTMLLLFAFLVICIKGRKLDYCTLTALLIAVILVFSLTDSRLSSGLAAAGVIIAAVLHAIDVHRPSPRWLAVILGSCFALCAIASIGLTVAYGSGDPLLMKIDSVLGGRLRLGHDAIAKFGPTPFGQHISLTSATLTPSGAAPKGTYNFIDSIYVQFIVRQGIAFLVIYIVSMGFATYKAFRAGDAFLGTVFILIAVHGIIDNQTMFLWMNPGMFYAITLAAEPQPSPNQRRENDGMHARTP